MPFLECLAVVLFGLTRAAPAETSGGPSPTTLACDALVQPRGGTGAGGEFPTNTGTDKRTSNTGRSGGSGHKGVTKGRRAGRRHHRIGARNANAPKPDSFTVKQK